jgi:hypothetical protein
LTVSQSHCQVPMLQSGALTLAATGFAERRVVYRIDNQGTEQESVESGRLLRR